MIAYVIKNKEGKYFCGFDAFAGINIFSERIIDGLNTQTPTLEHCMEEIEDCHLKDCEVVEITIAEGDLEQQIREQVCEEIRSAIDNEDNELWGDNNRILSIRADEFNKILDQIEKGEQE